MLFSSRDAASAFHHVHTSHRDAKEHSRRCFPVVQPLVALFSVRRRLQSDAHWRRWQNMASTMLRRSLAVVLMRFIYLGMYKQAEELDITYMAPY